MSGTNNKNTTPSEGGRTEATTASSTSMNSLDPPESIRDSLHEKRYVFERIRSHRRKGNFLELEVVWTRGYPTWEPERRLHEDCLRSLVMYWDSIGGRPANPENPNFFEVFAIHDHQKHGRGYRLLVEWVGYKEMTWEPESVIRVSVNEMVDKYFQKQN